MTDVLITIDTELSARLHQQGAGPERNLASSIWGRCSSGAFGIGWQMDVLDAQAAKGVFFVDPLPALVYGEEIVRDIVAPIVERGHEVQLHIHTEWLEWATKSPVGGRCGRNLADFAFADQVTLLGLGADLLERAGAPRPIAFRAGNFGANDDSLRALAQIGVRWDSSVNAAYFDRGCEIDCAPGQIDPVVLHGVIELPVSALFDAPGRLRPAQVCALSKWEMRATLKQAARQRQQCFVAVTHSFEMLARDRQRPNRMVMARFRDLCQAVAGIAELRTLGFCDLDAFERPSPHSPQPVRLGPNPVRTGHRIAAQAVATWLYERRLRPA